MIGHVSDSTPPESSDGDIAQADATYSPVRGFLSWAGVRLDLEPWETGLEQVSVLEGDAAERGLRAANSAAAIDTGAIEGLYTTDRNFTYSIAVREAMSDEALRAHDERLPDFYQAHMRAFDHAEEFVRSSEPMTHVWIRELHQILTAPQATYPVHTSLGWQERELPKGQYKTHPNHVMTERGIHAYAPVLSTPSEMERFLEELRSPEFANAHPVLQAAYAHHAFVYIHPFADGNGRVARVLTSVFLRRAGRVPFLVWRDQREEYFAALYEADQGRYQAFVDFVLDRAVEGLNFVVSESAPRPEQVVASLGKLFVSHGGLTHQEVDAAAVRLHDHIHDHVERTKGSLVLPPGVAAQWVEGQVGGFPTIDPRFRSVVNGTSLGGVHLTSTAPAYASVNLGFRVVIARDEAARYAFRIESSVPSRRTLDVRLREAHPLVSNSLNDRLGAFVRSLVSFTLRELESEASKRLRGSGY